MTHDWGGWWFVLWFEIASEKGQPFGQVGPSFWGYQWLLHSLTSKYTPKAYMQRQGKQCISIYTMTWDLFWYAENKRQKSVTYCR
jgi:hypothetical protein